jgi:Glycosyl transferase family 2
MCACDPARLVVIVPAHHDAGRHASARLDRLRPLTDCLRSLRATVDQWRAGTGLAFDEVRVVLVDDGSPVELATLLPSDVVTSVDVLRLDTRRGQGAALNAALTTYRAGAYALTDSDCVVGPDWITTIDKLAATDDGTDGAAGPPWPHRRPRTRKATWLTRQEAALIEHCTSRALRHGATARLDCRNAWLRAGVAGKLGRADFFPEDAGAALSGITSRLMESAGVRLGFDHGLVVRHQPVTSLRAQASTYFRRGATSDLDRHYAAGHRSLAQAFATTYARRHFVEPVRAGVSPAYVLLAHGAYWCGLARRSRNRNRSRSRSRSRSR